MKKTNVIVNIFVKSRILKEITSFSRNQIFGFETYLEMFS